MKRKFSKVKKEKNLKKDLTEYQVAREEERNFTKRQRRVSVRANIYRVSH
jgi:hypothetical protein